MRVLVVVFLTAFAVLTIAYPASIDIRSKQVCANAPGTVAGTTLYPRANGAITWCAPNTQTYIVLKVIAVIWHEEARKLECIITTMNEFFEQWIPVRGDTLVLGGIFAHQFPNCGLQFHFHNANNHQLTFGVIKAALVALWDWMEQHEIATCTFDIFDGENQVGAGVFEGL